MKTLASLAVLSAVALLSAFLAAPTACTPTAPSSNSEASPPPTGTAPPPPALTVGSMDAAPAPSACIDACNRMVALGCVELLTCPVVLANEEAHRMRPDPALGNLPLTCADLAGEPPSKLPPPKTATDILARGWTCGP